MDFIVKNTTRISVLDLVLPYSCRGCGKTGEVLCGRCKKYLLGDFLDEAGESEAGAELDSDLARSREAEAELAKGGGAELDLVSGRKAFLDSGRIREDGGEIRLGRLKEFYAVGYREGVLRRLVVEYKYSARRAVARVLGELVAEMIQARVLGEAKSEVVLVPLPTISRHVRERGFDHTLRLAKEVERRVNGGSGGFSAARGSSEAARDSLNGARGSLKMARDSSDETCGSSGALRIERVLRRVNKTTQVGTDEATREKQAREAYEVVGKIDSEKTYLLLDDIWTTGASMRAAAEKMYAAGARKIFGVVVCKGR